MTHAVETPTGPSRVTPNGVRAGLVPEYVRRAPWEHPGRHRLPEVRLPEVRRPEVRRPEVRRPDESVSAAPTRSGTLGPLERVAVAIALVVLVVAWPLQVVVAAVCFGGGWLIDDALRDVVPSHAPHLRRALRPIPWGLAIGGAVAVFLAPAATATVALALLGLAALLYGACEVIAFVRAMRHDAHR